MPVIPVFRELKQEDYELELSWDIWLLNNLHYKLKICLKELKKKNKFDFFYINKVKTKQLQNE